MSSLLLIAINTIADFLLFETVIAAVLVGVAWGTIRLGRIKAPVHRHMVWLYTLIAIVIMPVLWLYGPNLTLFILPAQNPIGAALMQPVDLQPVAWLADDYSFWALLRGTNIFVWLWCVGFLFLSTRLLLSGHRLSRMIHFATPISDDIAPKMVLAKRIELMVTSQADNPVCLGLFRPVILLPEQMYHNSSREELHMMLCHELAHIERKDCWINLFQRVVEAVLFFHPFVWYASFQLTYQREQLCDNHVIAEGVSPRNYVQLLTRIVDQGFEKKCFHAVALFEGKLLTRARGLLELGNKYQIKASRQATVTGVMAMVMCLTIGTIRLEAEPVESDSPASITEEEDLQQFEDDDYEGIVYEADEVDEPPRLIRAMDPIYPFMAKREGIEGRVMVRCVVTKEGNARDAKVFESEPVDIFDASALKAIKQYKFKPAIKDGEAVNVRVIQEVIYKLPPGETVGEDQQYYEDDENGNVAKRLDEVLEKKEPSSPVPERPRMTERSRATRPAIARKPAIVRRSEVAESLTDISKIMEDARFSPHFTDGESDGFTIIGIKADSLLRKMGLREGDIIHGINGDPIKSPDDVDVEKLHNELRSGSNISMRIKRRGWERTLNYRLRE